MIEGGGVVSSPRLVHRGDYMINSYALDVHIEYIYRAWVETVQPSPEDDRLLEVG